MFTYVPEIYNNNGSASKGQHLVCILVYQKLIEAVDRIFENVVHSAVPASQSRVKVKQDDFTEQVLSRSQIDDFRTCEWVISFPAILLFLLSLPPLILMFVVLLCYRLEDLFKLRSQIIKFWGNLETQPLVIWSAWCGSSKSLSISFCFLFLSQLQNRSFSKQQKFHLLRKCFFRGGQSQNSQIFPTL